MGHFVSPGKCLTRTHALHGAGKNMTLRGEKLKIEDVLHNFMGHFVSHGKCLTRTHAKLHGVGKYDTKGRKALNRGCFA